MINVKQIIDAWIISFNPTDKQKELAEKRGKICDDCLSKKNIFENKKWSAVCGECGCPIGKKIFANEFDPCPLHKWREIDDEYFPNRKKNKTLF